MPWGIGFKLFDVVVNTRNISLNFGQNRVNNSGDIFVVVDLVVIVVKVVVVIDSRNLP